VDPAPLGTKKKEARKKNETRRDGRRDRGSGSVHVKHGLWIFFKVNREAEIKA